MEQVKVVVVAESGYHNLAKGQKTILSGDELKQALAEKLVEPCDPELAKKGTKGALSTKAL